MALKTTAARVYSAALEAQTDVTVTHNLGKENVVVQIYDDAGMQTIPETCSITDENNVRITSLWIGTTARVRFTVVSRFSGLGGRICSPQ